jgi:hypothetical protein
MISDFSLLLGYNTKNRDCAKSDFSNGLLDNFDVMLDRGSLVSIFKATVALGTGNTSFFSSECLDSMTVWCMLAALGSMSMDCEWFLV